MATHELYRSKGFGKMLVKEAEQILLDKNVNFIWCKARVSARGFYKSLNYKIIGDLFDVPKVGKHYLMFKDLQLKQVLNS